MKNVHFRFAVAALAALGAFVPAAATAQEAPDRWFAAAGVPTALFTPPALALPPAPALSPVAAQSSSVELAATRSAWKYPLIGAAVGGALGALFAYSVHQDGGSEFVGPEAYVAWTLGAAAIGAGVGYLVHVASR